MPTFSYKAIDADGRFVAGEVIAADPRDVARQLAKLGYVSLDATAGRQALKAERSFLWFRRAVGRREITVFLRELSLILRAGLTVDDALLLLAGEEGPGLASVARDLRSAITAGASFGDALQRHPALFGPDLVAMVRVAEASGNLEVVLESVSEERARTEALMDKVASSLRYPAVLLILALGVLIFFMVAVVPQFAAVLRDFGQKPEGLVAFVLATSDFLLAHGQTIMAVLLGLIVLVMLARQNAAVRRLMKQHIARIPGLRGILELRRTVLFCSSLGMLLTNGVTLTNALQVLLELPGASSEGLDGVVEGVRRGGRLVDALARMNYLPPLALKMLRVGEESGELATVTRRTAEFYETKLSDRLDRLAGVIGPTAIVLIAAIVGGLIVSILSAILGVNQLVTQ
ncbi:MAG: type II secretion system F family protein [Rhizobiales bacterium]|nr:type II secretion system F family protein [Hyphomicrobiales bacterium]